MNRRQLREQAFLLLFANSFNNYSLDEILDNQNLYETINSIEDFSTELFNGVKENEEAIDQIIAKNSTKWKSDRISKVASIILKIAIFEIMFKEDIPTSVSANEAVELAKKYGSEEESAFVNGILGSVCREINNV